MLAKVGASGLLAIASTSASSCRIPSSIAGWKSLSLILSNGGAWNGRVLGLANGFDASNWERAVGPAAAVGVCGAGVCATSVPGKMTNNDTSATRNRCVMTTFLTSACGSSLTACRTLSVSAMPNYILFLPSPRRASLR